MLKFGKKITYRPLLLSLLIAILPGIMATNILESVLYGILIGAVFFLFVFLAYYFPNIPTLFVYWENYKTEIRYCNIYTWKHRLLGMIFPPAAKMVTIKKASIKSVTVMGDLHKKYEMPMAIPYSGYVAVLSPVLSMIHQPEVIRLTLKNGSTVDLSVARDYTYSRDNTLEKLDKFFKDLGNIPIHADLNNNKADSSTSTV